ncbi:hypothetical protein, partial [Mycobacterium kansasii]|uniref:hypothetical protein n=1 Tax=Mycobacterium kansasii TaxID=1768 RepID=UPI00195A16EB
HGLYTDSGVFYLPSPAPIPATPPPYYGLWGTLTAVDRWGPTPALGEAAGAWGPCWPGRRGGPILPLQVSDL